MIRHIAIKETGGLKAVFGAGIAIALKQAQSIGASEGLLVVARNLDLGPGIMEDILGRGAMALLRKGNAVRVFSDCPPIRATTVRNASKFPQSAVVLSAYLDPKTTGQVLGALRGVSVCVHVLWRPEHVDKLVAAQNAQLVSILKE